MERRTAEEAARAAAEQSAEHFAAVQRPAAQTAQPAGSETAKPRRMAPGTARNVELLRTARPGDDAELGREAAQADRAPAASGEPTVAPRRASKPRRNAKRT